jgi:hypothetical protein
MNTWGVLNNPPAPPRHICMACQHEWSATDIWLCWPIRIRLRRFWYGRPLRWHWCWLRPKRWGWQVGTREDGRRLFGWTWQWGPLKLYVGPHAWGYRHPRRLACPQCGLAHWERGETR